MLKKIGSCRCFSESAVQMQQAARETTDLNPVPDARFRSGFDICPWMDRFLHICFELSRHVFVLRHLRALASLFGQAQEEKVASL